MAKFGGHPKHGALWLKGVTGLPDKFPINCFLKMGQSWPLFIYFRLFQMTQINKN